MTKRRDNRMSYVIYQIMFFFSLQLLYEVWASPKCWYKLQPLDHIRLLFLLIYVIFIDMHASSLSIP